MYEYRRLTPEQRCEVVAQRLARGFPPHQPPHPVKHARYYILTAACYEHKRYINTLERRQQLLDMLFEQMIHHGVNMLAWVILDYHYHMLVDMDDFDVLGGIFKQIHGRLSYEWNKADNAKGRKVWYRYYDRGIRSERHYFTTLNYIHYNPVKHGLSTSPYDWSWSSVHWYLQHHSREWLRDVWREYPVRDYGKGWDT